MGLPSSSSSENKLNPFLQEAGPGAAGHRMLALAAAQQPLE